MHVGERGEPPGAAEPAREEDVALQDVDVPADDELPRLAGAADHLAGGDPQTRVGPQIRVPVRIVGSQRLLEPVDAELLERACTLRGRGDVPARLHVAGHAPSLVRVDHDLHRVADRLAHGADHGEVVAPVGEVEAELYRAHAALLQHDASRGPHLR